MKKLLITGGAGFIGSNFIRYLFNKNPDYKIVNLDKLTYFGNLDNLIDVERNKNYNFIKGNICDKDLVDYILKVYSVDTIINFAAESYVDKPNQGDSINYFRKTNIFGVSVLLEKAVKNKVEKFLQISSDEVYGSAKEGSFKEDSKINPTNPYSKSKAEAEDIVLNHSKNLEVLITRSCNNFGPYQYPKRFIPLTITNLLEDKKVLIYGYGKQIRDWIYVLENCDAINFVLNNGKAGEIYNISMKNEMENILIAKKILEILRRGENEIEYVKDRKNHDKRYSIDNTKLIQLGYDIKNDFEDRLEQTVYWYISHKSWWKKIKDNNYFKEWYNHFYTEE